MEQPLETPDSVASRGDEGDRHDSQGQPSPGAGKPDPSRNFLREVWELVRDPAKYITAHFITTILVVGYAEIFKIFIDHIQVGHEHIVRSDMTIAELVTTLEVLWIVVILGCGAYEGFVHLKRKWR